MIAYHVILVLQCNCICLVSFPVHDYRLRDRKITSNTEHYAAILRLQYVSAVIFWTSEPGTLTANHTSAQSVSLPERSLVKANNSNFSANVTLRIKHTRKLCYRKDDRAMRAI